jgi:hypothetical protein
MKNEKKQIKALLEHVKKYSKRLSNARGGRGRYYDAFELGLLAEDLKKICTR